MKSNFRITGVLLLLCTVLSAGAKPRYETVLPTPPKDGYFAISFPYEVAGRARADLSDLRILDAQRNEVPYGVRDDVRQYHRQEFVSYVMEVSHFSRRTDILVEGPGESISSLTLRVKNAEAKKIASLEGSNDSKNWYAIRDRISLDDLADGNATENYLTLQFPKSDYAYYMLSVNDSLSAPLNVMGVGAIRSENDFSRNVWVIPPVKTEIKTVQKNTEVVLSFGEKYLFSKAIFYVSAPQYYSRSVQVVMTEEPETETDRRPRLIRSKGSFSRDYWGGYLDSEDSVHSISLNQYGDTLKFSIYNGDDRPLQIDSIHACVDRQYLVAYLKAGATYRVTAGDDRAEMPRYDLSFQSQLGDTLPALEVTAPWKEREKDPADEPSALMTFVTTYGIWIVIGVIIIQMVYVLYRMGRKMNGENRHSSKNKK